MHVRTLSSRQTFYLKFILTSLLGLMSLLMVFAVCKLLPGSNSDVPLALVAVVMLFWCGLTALMVSRCIGWKRVRIDTRAFYISNYFKQIEVPLGQLCEAREQRRIGPRSIALRFSPATAFGEVVRFKPRTYPWFWRRHPVVAELEAIAAGRLPTQAELDRAAARDRTRLLTSVVLYVALFAASCVVIEGAFTHGAPYRLGLEALRRNPAVVAALGAPVTPGWFPAGEISYGAQTGCAAIRLGLHGARAKGDAVIYAFESNGQWQLYHVWLQPEGRGERIEVVDDATSAGSQRCAARPACGSEGQSAQADGARCPGTRP